MDEFNEMKKTENSADKPENTDDIKTGYTVTPQGGFYSETPASSPDSTLENAPETAGEEPAPNIAEPVSEPSAADTVRSESEPHNAESPMQSGYRGYASYQPYTGTPTTPQRKPKKSSFSLATVMVSVVLAAIIGATGGIVGMLAVQSANGTSGGSSGNPVASGTASGSNVSIDVTNVEATVGVAVAEKVTPSVVGIRTTVSVSSFFGGTQEASGEGSGVIYTSDGYIITNYHVISDAIEYGKNSSAIQVFLSDDPETGYDATVVGYNISNDLAVVKINGNNLPAIEWADSSELQVGQYVMAVGNPGGLEFMGSATWGIISGLNRVISDSYDGTGTELIQTDAAINPGNSGGALVNIEGELIGINSSKLVSESVEGMGFAIPSNTVKDICDKIIAKEYDPDPYIGVTISERYDPDTLKYWGYPVGAVIYSVASGSPAEDAGLRQGDIITEFNGQEVTHYSLLSELLADCEPGTSVDIEIYRNGKYYDGTIKIGSNNSQ